MSKMSELDICVGELRNAAQSLTQVADSILTVADTLAGNTPEQDYTPDSISQKQTTPEVTLEQVRGVLAEKSRDGYTDAVRALLVKHGANKLSEIEPAEYAALLAETEALGNE